MTSTESVFGMPGRGSARASRFWSSERTLGKSFHAAGGFEDKLRAEHIHSEEMIGRHLWEIGELEDVAANKEAFSVFQAKEYVRYHNLPLRARDGTRCQVEFVSNVYDVEGECVIQCNIRKISLRTDAEEAFRDHGLEEASAGKAKSDVLAVL